MIRASIKVSGSNPLLVSGRRSLGGKAPLPLSFGQDQMRRLGQFALDTVISRTKRGIGSDGNSMPALSQKKSAVKAHGKFVRQRAGYAAWKSAHGLQPIRDLVGTGKDGGHMLDNASVRSVSEQGVTMAFTSRKARAKALANEKRTPFFSFSPADEKAIFEFAKKLFNAEVQSIARRTFRRAA